jgi:hypothetical protein
MNRVTTRQVALPLFAGSDLGPTSCARSSQATTLQERQWEGAA